MFNLFQDFLPIAHQNSSRLRHLREKCPGKSLRKQPKGSQGASWSGAKLTPWHQSQQQKKKKNLFSLVKDCKVLTQLWAQWRGGDSPKSRQNASHKTLSLLRKWEAREIFLKGEEKLDVYSHHQREGRSKWIRNQRLNIIGLADKAISNSLTASVGVCWTKQRNLKVLNKIGSFHL